MIHRHRRRTFAALLGAAVAGVALLVPSACSSTGTSSRATAPAGATTSATTSGVASGTSSSVNAGAASAVLRPVLGGKLTVAVETEVAHAWDPRQMRCDASCETRVRTVLEPLLVVSADVANADPLKAVSPFLAEALTPDATYTTWTLKVRPGIAFTDGSALNADVVVFNLRAQLASPVTGPDLTEIATIARVDDLTVSITTKEPLPSLPAHLTGQAGLVASQKWLEAVDAGKADPMHMVGTGPFMFDSYLPGQRLIVVRNPDYWRKDKHGNTLPYLDSLDLRVIPDGKARTTALETGVVDVVLTSNGQDIAELRPQKPRFPMFELSQFGQTGYVLLHLTQPPFDDQRVRCAASYAVAKQSIIDATQAGIPPVADGPFSPGQEGFLVDNGAPNFDPDKARTLVESYAKDHGGAPPAVVVGVPSGDRVALLQAELLVANWTAVGFKATVRALDASTYVEAALKGDRDFSAFAWRGNAGFSIDQQYASWHSSFALPDGQLAPNAGRIKDPKVDADLAAARAEADPTRRRALAEDINRQFATQCWLIPIYWTVLGIAHRAGVTGIDADPLPDGVGRISFGQGISGPMPLEATWITRGH